ncbi:MAG: helix-turn-helix transcriptional regulator [Acidaminococcaceae bacterium]|jgi:DNA-binding Xre family transcriptional regulator|nr:helix-turn-helix transcriptional regulator [Acidaminococcaceae bacterium]
MIISKIPSVVAGKGLNIAELTRRTGLNKKTVIKLMYADFKSISVDTLDRLCSVLNVNTEDLLKYTSGTASIYPALERLPEKYRDDNKRVRHAKIANGGSK